MKKTQFKLAVQILASIFFVAATIAPNHILSQANEPTLFLCRYVKVKPGKMNTYWQNLKEVWKPIHQERLKQGKITGWSLYEILYPSGSSTEYDLVSIDQVKGWNAVEKMSDGIDEIAKKVLNKEQLARFEKQSEIRDIIRIELWAMEDGVFKSTSGPPSKYHFANYMLVTQGKWEEYMQMEKKLVKPVHEEQMKAGGRAGWGLYVMWLPAGDNLPYQAATIDFYDNWGDLGPVKTTDLWKKIHPDKSLEYMTRQIVDSRKLVKQEVRMLVDYVQ